MTREMNITQIITLLAMIATALMAGLFYSYSCSVNPALGKLPDRQYLQAMQNINAVIQNLAFFAGFMGAVILLPWSTYLNYSGTASPRFIWLLATSILYIAGVFGVTVACNVPLNEALASFNIQAASDREVAAQRAAFEQPWLFWHQVRTVASVTSLMCALVATTLKEQ